MRNERFSRQSFLGATGQANIERCIVGIAGLGGGGAHYVQQLAHVGFMHYVLFDNDVVEDSNLNRMVTATEADVVVGTPKIDAARRSILAVRGMAIIDAHKCRWQEYSEPLRRCDLILGTVDSFAERRELE